MKRLTITRRLAFTIVLLLIGVISQGQTRTGLSGSGTSESPWQIGSAADWEEFATHTQYWSGHVVMIDNIPNATEVAAGTTSVSTMIGTESEGFEGVFDGKYNATVHTLTFSGNDMYAVAPFFDAYGATIKNLIVEGDIIVNAGWAAGLIYMNYGETTVENVTISLDITGGNNGNAGSYCGGFAVQNLMYEEEECVLNFTNCIYNGKIKAGTSSGGFCTSYNEGSINFTDCVFAPAEGSEIEGGETFGPGTVGSDCYYTDKLETTAQGEKAYLTSVPSGNIGKFVKQIQGFNVYKDVAVVTNIKDAYAYTGTTITITPTVTFDGINALSPNNYATTAFSPSPVQAVGAYTFTITPDNSKDYYGSYTKSFDVVELSGTGEENDPYIIASTADWNCFALYVNDNGESFSGKFLKLTANITVSTMVGTEEHPFKGTFDGQIGSTYGANTLTFNYGTSAEHATEEIVAPFRYTDGATIKFLIIDGAVHTDAGKESGLIGVNTRTSSNTTVSYIVNNVDLYCHQTLWDAEGGGYAYDGGGISFAYCSYEGMVSANNYHGGFCGKADSNTTFERCLFDPESGGVYWAENFVYDYPYPDLDYSTCYYTLGNNQEESTQGIMVYVNDVPDGSMGHKITTFHEKEIYEPVTVVISGVNHIYIYNDGAELLNISEVDVTFDGDDAIDNGWCTKVITNEEAPLVSVSSVTALGNYTLTITGVDNESAETNKFKYKGTITQAFYVVEASSSDWTKLQQALNASGPITIDLSDYGEFYKLNS